MSASTPFRSSAAQTTRALLELRDLILCGELAAGERLSELAVVERLGVSRTPVRAALQRLCEEGLATALPGGGYAVAAFSEREVDDAIELRGTLEGLAARLAAERGASQAQLDAAYALLARIDAVLDSALTEDDFADYVQHNEQLHALLIAMAGSALLAREFARTVQLPFASPNGFVMAQAVAPEARLILTLAQDQHRQVVQAIAQRQGARAEALMREHARLAQRNFHHALRDQHAIDRVPGNALIRRQPPSAS
ncbi:MULTISPECIES: GntR family transcriptional regulator [Pseudoxanthomonas]|uniref:GntR family transcriptional regulator of vanillate catabolism n=1 Tax=Pseudoxanthomonas winnipegensis TaxID=2480810 RepID=A0AAW8GFQ3_9GAMM|nr:MULTISPECIES: GntR family transcriptional regulator [Pseudoxanthomonas]MDQ1120612.1 GntR family transcriptional regulator of vanillate catabolism [Pseudoxanthomonas winnipegensis]MDQ1133835.1 GntR family transcriptional regulator of vanillate catabolism [Pseudoxanthomonas winnipegensis]MDR6139927.1 GntR family transcriptional regulator of vanillate catabolism [Pseudoxanthomonas sp. SORGH_AS_0997]